MQLIYLAVYKTFPFDREKSGNTLGKTGPEAFAISPFGW
jgi:hypothetical protein